MTPLKYMDSNNVSLDMRREILLLKRRFCTLSWYLSIVFQILQKELITRQPYIARSSQHRGALAIPTTPQFLLCFDMEEVLHSPTALHCENNEVSCIVTRIWKSRFRFGNFVSHKHSDLSWIFFYSNCSKCCDLEFYFFFFSKLD